MRVQKLPTMISLRMSSPNFSRIVKKIHDVRDEQQNGTASKRLTSKTRS